MRNLPSLLAIPGVGLRAESWGPTLEPLADAHHARVVQLPGHGEPAHRKVDLHPEAQADRLHSALATLPRPVVVLGHSASCQIAAHVAARHLGAVAGLVLVGPTTDPAGATWPRLAARWLATARHEDPRQVPVLARDYRRTGLATMLRCMEAARHDPIDVPLREACLPTLVLRGRHDRIATEGWAAAVADAGGPGSRSATLPAGGHMVPLTHGGLVAGQLSRFLSQLLQP